MQGYRILNRKHEQSLCLLILPLFFIISPNDYLTKIFIQRDEIKLTFQRFMVDGLYSLLCQYKYDCKRARSS